MMNKHPQGALLRLDGIGAIQLRNTPKRVAVNDRVGDSASGPAARDSLQKAAHKKPCLIDGVTQRHDTRRRAGSFAACQTRRGGAAMVLASHYIGRFRPAAGSARRT